MYQIVRYDVTKYIMTPKGRKQVREGFEQYENRQEAIDHKEKYELANSSMSYLWSWEVEKM